MKKLLLILFCLFVTFEVKSKDVILECDGIEIKNIYYSNENVINDVVQTSKKEVFLLNICLMKQGFLNLYQNVKIYIHFKLVKQKFYQIKTDRILWIGDMEI